MGAKIDMTKGSISRGLYKMALPVMGTSFLQMAYNLVDMIWIGRVGSRAVAAVGSAGFYLWMSFAFILISKVGAEVRVAQNVGAKNMKRARDYARNAIQLNLVMAVLYGVMIYMGRGALIGFFNLGDQGVIQMAESYLVIIALGMIFNFTNPVLTGIFNGYGDSKTPFLMNTIGLIANMILDPLLIFGWGPVPAMGVAGAAIATVLAQVMVTLSFVIYIVKGRGVVNNLGMRILPEKYILGELFKLGFPVALHSGMFTGFSMGIARIIASWGPVPIAVQKVGSQIESLSWMTALGFQAALGTFVGQNFGADQPERIKKGYMISVLIMTVVGVLTTLLLYFGAEPIFAIFIPEEESIRLGIDYLKILSFSQWFMCMEILTAGAFNGLGKTTPPSIVSIILNAARIPLALVLSAETLLGLNGVWWSISVTAVLKGVILVGWFVWLTKKWEFFQRRAGEEVKGVSEIGLEEEQ